MVMYRVGFVMIKRCKLWWMNLVFLITFLWADSIWAGIDPFVAPWEKVVEKKKAVVERKQQHPGISDRRIGNRKIPSERVVEEYERGDVGEEEPPKPPTFIIDGIIYKDKSGVVISGNRLLVEGDKVTEDCVIHTISLDTVWVQCGENLWEFGVKRGKI